ncbi:GreA/GreB family elongation factor [Photobacterium damselae subsp. piscicida]|nr:GreA/GreB family elongation factor [Photobacterium damselae subsp. piscicida]
MTAINSVFLDVLSILSPLGSELIGRRVDDDIYAKENGKYLWFKIMAVKNKHNFH